MITIKKYQNRKLYNTETSKYINVSDLLKFNYESFQVIDNETKANITIDTLWSAVCELSKQENSPIQKQKEELIKLVISLNEDKTL